MNASFWQRIHGGSTHFPIVLVLASVVFDFIAWRSRDEVLRRGLHAAGLGSAVVGMLGGIGAVIGGLILTRRPRPGSVARLITVALLVIVIRPGRTGGLVRPVLAVSRGAAFAVAGRPGRHGSGDTA